MFLRKPLTVFVLFQLSIIAFVSTVKQSKDCAICRAFSKSFDDGLKRTAHHNFEGGNTLWEERKLGSFATSETRLVDIIEHIDCKQDDNDRPRVTDIKSRCLSFAGDHEEAIEEWWFKSFVAAIKSATITDFDPHRSLHDFLCVDFLRHCCPFGTFGPSCTPCERLDGLVCGGRGECDGNGTREGSGRCSCSEGYSGDKCDTCASGFFRVTESSPPAGTVVECQRCNAGCKSSCTGPSPLDCTDGCRDGYLWTAPAGCGDIDECATGASTCIRGTFCRNLAGSFTCDACSDGCALCTAKGLGPDVCLDCSAGYERSPAAGNQCVDIDECAASTAPCAGANERCVNRPATFVCECLDEFTRGADGVCAPKPAEPPKDEEVEEDEETPTETENDADSEKEADGPITERKKRLMEKMSGNMKTLKPFAIDKEFMSTLGSDDLEFLDKINENPELLKSIKLPDDPNTVDGLPPSPPLDAGTIKPTKDKSSKSSRKQKQKNESKEPNTAGEQIRADSDLKTEVLRVFSWIILAFKNIYLRISLHDPIL